jgi:predicted ABC-type ATPase
MSLYGRGDVVREVTAAGDRLVVLAGDRGVGKSSLLAELQRRAVHEQTVVTADLVSLGNSPASLQQGLLQGFVGLAARLASDQGAVKILAAVGVAAARARLWFGYDLLAPVA